MDIVTALPYFNAMVPLTITSCWGRSRLSKKDQQYLIKQKVGEDSKTRTYFAIDLKVKRPVTFIQLKKNLADNESRLFLLQARSLGQLQHPGLLPLYDMGIHNERFFYTHRMPPGKPLWEKIKADGSTQGRSQQFTQILIRLSDTLDYLHRNRVTLQRFSAKDISIGSFGEVVIHNLSLATHHRQASDASSFSEGKQADMKNLAELGLKLWVGSRRTDEITIRDWDSQAQQLPVELQEIFDRAFLERGGKYPDPAHFSQDLLNFQEGLPPEHRKDDLLFRIKGLFFKRKKESFALIAAIAVSFLYIVSKTHPIQVLKKENEEFLQKQTQLEQTLAAHDLQFIELDSAFDSRKTELNNQKEKLDEQRGQSQEMLRLKNQASQKRQSLEDKIADLEKKRLSLEKSESEWQKRADSWEDRIRKQSENLLQRGQQLAEKGEVPSRPFSVLELRSQPLALSTYVEELGLEAGWLSRYLENISDKKQESFLIPLSGDLKFYSEDPASNRLLMLHGGISVLDPLTLRQEKFAPPVVGLKSAFFSPRNDFFYGTDGQSILTFNALSLLRGVSIEAEFDDITLLPHGSPRQFHAWNQSNFFSGGVIREIGEPPSYDPNAIFLEEGTLEVISSKDGRFWRLHEEGLDLLPLQNRVISFDGPPQHWFSQVNGGLAVIRDGVLAIFPWPDNFGPISISHRYALPEKFRSPDKIVGDLSKGEIWLQKESKVIFLSPEFEESAKGPNSKGKLFWWKAPHLFSLEEGGLRISKITRERLERLNKPPVLPGDHLAEWKDNPPPGLDFRGGWSEPGDPLVLVLNGKRSIEVWSQHTWSRVGHLALAKEDLKGIQFQESDNSVLALSEQGTWLRF